MDFCMRDEHEKETGGVFTDSLTGLYSHIKKFFEVVSLHLGSKISFENKV
jgi:hypothetical protein